MIHSKPDRDRIRQRAAAKKRAGQAIFEALNNPDAAFLHALSQRMHDARFSRSGEDYPVARNFIRALIDAALSGDPK